MTSEDEARVREIVREELEARGDFRSLLVGVLEEASAEAGSMAPGDVYRPVKAFPLPDGVEIGPEGFAVRSDGSRYLPPAA